MLDDANSNFVNGVVTVIRYACYIWLAVVALYMAARAFVWLWKGLRRIFPSRESDLDKARQRMRDLGY